MRLITSIVVMKHMSEGMSVIDSVLRVKHPEGSDPVQLINAVLEETISNQKEQRYSEGGHWGDVVLNVTKIDWSHQQMHIQETPSWYVFDIDERLQQNQPDPYYFFQATPKPYSLVR